MTCYTPEPTDEHSVTPISPLPEMQSPTREMPFPLGTYGKSVPSVRIPNDIDRYPALDPNHLESLPDLELDESPMAMHPRHIHPYHSIGNHLGPNPHAVAHAHAQPGPAPRDLEDAPGEDDTHPPDWNTVESFQTRLQDLDYTLTQSMSKWAREQDPNSEIPGHHEGLGM